MRISTAHNIATLVTQSFKMATVGVGTKSRDKRGFFCKFKRKGKTREVKKIFGKGSVVMWKVMEALAQKRNASKPAAATFEADE